MGITKLKTERKYLKKRKSEKKNCKIFSKIIIDINLYKNKTMKPVQDKHYEIHNETHYS